MRVVVPTKYGSIEITGRGRHVYAILTGLVTQPQVVAMTGGLEIVKFEDECEDALAFGFVRSDDDDGEGRVSGAAESGASIGSGETESSN